MEELESVKSTTDFIIEAPTYSEDEVKYRSFLIGRLESAAIQRESPHPEFDDKTYSQQYEENARIAHSYLKPKKNVEDVRIVTGTTQEKEITLLSSILNYNFEADIQAFDENDMPAVEVGQLAEDLVRKSRQIEDYDDKRRLIYKEMLDQGTNFVEEVWNERWAVEKKMKKLDFLNGVNLKDIDWDARLKKVQGKCESNLIDGRKVYLGNIREFFIEKQPYLFIAEYISYQEAEAVFNKWERWKNVPRTVAKLSPEEFNSSTSYRDWTLQEIQQDMVEVVKYQDPWNNEFMIILNGVMMMPIGFPLTAISSTGEYTLAKGDLEPISKFFAYSKSYPAKTKVDQAVKDEFLRLFILKTRQSAEPPYINNTNSIISRRVFGAGKISSNIDIKNFHPVFGDRPLGVTQAEMAIYQLINDQINEKTASPVFSGDKTTGDPTATEIREMQKQQMVKMGLAILGVIQLEKQLCKLRVPNLLMHWTSKVDRRLDKFTGKVNDIYASFSVQGTDENGQNVLKIIEMNPEMASTMMPDQIMAEENMLSDAMRRPVRKTYTDPNQLRNSITYTWFYTITPTERDTSDLDRVLFSKTMQEAYGLFGPQSVNQDYAKKRFATVSKEDPNKFFVQGDQQAMMVAMAQGGQPGQPGAQPQQMPAQMPKKAQMMQR